MELPQVEENILAVFFILNKRENSCEVTVTAFSLCVSVCLCVSLSVSLCPCLSLCLSVSISVSVGAPSLPLNMSVYPCLSSGCLFLYACLSPSLPLSVCLSVSLFLSLSLSLFYANASPFLRCVNVLPLSSLIPGHKI